MFKNLVLLIFCSFIIKCSNSQPVPDVSGTWQYNTSDLSSGLHDSYSFKNDSIFQFTPTAYNALSRIKEISGIYSIKNGSIFFEVRYTMEYKGGYPVRNKTTTLSDHWGLYFGELEKVVHKDVITEEARFELGIDDKGNEYIEIDGYKYFKVKK